MTPAAPVADSAGSAVSASGALEMLGSLILVLGVIFALAWLARWLQGARAARGATLQVKGGAQLGAKEKVVLLQVGEHEFLLGVAPGSVNLLHRFDAPVSPAAAEPLRVPAFAERLRQAMSGKTTP